MFNFKTSPKASYCTVGVRFEEIEKPSNLTPTVQSMKPSDYFKTRIENSLTIMNHKFTCTQNVFIAAQSSTKLVYHFVFGLNNNTCRRMLISLKLKLKPGLIMCSVLMFNALQTLCMHMHASYIYHWLPARLQWAQVQSRGPGGRAQAS